MIKTPPQYMSEVSLRATTAMDPKTLFDRGPLKIERRWNTRFSHSEYHITLKIPFAKHRTFFDPAQDMLPLGRPAKFFAFGAIPQCRGGWHARGGIVYYDIITPNDWPSSLGYENPINLANYK